MDVKDVNESWAKMVWLTHDTVHDISKMTGMDVESVMRLLAHSEENGAAYYFWFPEHFCIEYKMGEGNVVQRHGHEFDWLETSFGELREWVRKGIESNIGDNTAIFLKGANFEGTV
jgi:hypothetical protein